MFQCSTISMEVSSELEVSFELEAGAAACAGYAGMYGRDVSKEDLLFFPILEFIEFITM